MALATGAPGRQHATTIFHDASRWLYGHSACGAAAPTRESEVASTFGPLSSQQKAAVAVASLSATASLTSAGPVRLAALAIACSAFALPNNEAELIVARRAKARGLSLSDFVRRRSCEGPAPDSRPGAVF